MLIDRNMDLQELAKLIGNNVTIKDAEIMRRLLSSIKDDAGWEKTEDIKKYQWKDLKKIINGWK